MKRLIYWHWRVEDKRSMEIGSPACLILSYSQLYKTAWLGTDGAEFILLCSGNGGGSFIGLVLSFYLFQMLMVMRDMTDIEGRTVVSWLKRCLLMGWFQ